MENKRFGLAEILSVITHRMLTDLTKIHDLLEWLTGKRPYSHTRSRFILECDSYLLGWFPELAPANAALDRLDSWLASDNAGGEEGVRMWIAEFKMLLPDIRDFYDVPRIPQDDHDAIDPYRELVQMRGGEDGIIVVGAEGMVRHGE